MQQRIWARGSPRIEFELSFSLSDSRVYGSSETTVSENPVLQVLRSLAALADIHENVYVNKSDNSFSGPDSSEKENGLGLLTTAGSLRLASYRGQTRRTD